jgi:hypothetical protein
MDFQFTSRPSTTPAWKTDSTPRKRPHTPSPESSSSFGFGANRNIPFIFATPARPSAEPYSWAPPPPNASPATTFPIPSLVEDVDMSEVSPPKAEEPKDSDERVVATGALRRVYKARHKTPRGKKLAFVRNRETDDEAEESDDENGDEHDLMSQNASNHYTLNVSSAPTFRTDMPYILLGYLQFFFNLSLILVFLYLLLQFIVTVQRDLEHRISEYSMGTYEISDKKV